MPTPIRFIRFTRFALLSLSLLAGAAVAQTRPEGKVTGTRTAHDEASALAVVARAQVGLPARVTGGEPYVGTFEGSPRSVSARAPVVVFLHGSSGVGLKAIADWQRWLAELGIASFAPDSFGLPDRLTYTSPIDKETYERIHALRASEIDIALKALAQATWADTGRMVLAGTSEGATAVARDEHAAFAGRIVYAWSCEDNYFVTAHRTAVGGTRPFLNIISQSDPFFSATNAWLGAAAGARGHCGAALKGNPNAAVLLVPDAPHTLLNLPAARVATQGFLTQVLKP
jgi:dienelactone hydrolase